MSSLRKTEAAVRAALGSRAKGSQGWSHAHQEAVRAELLKKNVPSDQVSAAFNLAVYGRLGAADQATALSYGMTPDMQPSWFVKAK